MSQPGAPSQGKDGSGSGPPTHSVPVDDAHYYRTPQDHLGQEQQQQQQQHARDVNVVNLQSPPSPDDFSLIGATRRSTSTSGNNSRLITPTSATSPVFGRRSHHTSDRHHHHYHHHNHNNSSGGSGSGPAASSPLSAGFSPTTAAGGGVGGSGGVRRQMDGLGRRSVPRASSQVALPRFARHGRRAGSGGPVLQPHRHQPLYYPQQQRNLRQSSSSASRHSSRSGGRHHHHPPPSAAQHHRSATSPADSSSSSSSHSTPAQPSLYGSTGLFATGGRHATLPYGNAAAAAAAGHHVRHSAYIPTFVGKTPSVASPTSTVDSRGSARAMPHGSAQRQHRQRRGNTVGMTASAQAWHRGSTTSATAAAAAAAAGGAHSTSSSFASSSHRRHAHHHQQQQGTHRHRHARSSTSGGGRSRGDDSGTGGDDDDEGHTTSAAERGGRQPLPGYTPDITRVASHGANTVSTRTDSPSSTAVSSPATSGAPSRLTPTSSPVHGDERYAFPLPQQYQQQQRRGMPRVDSNATLTTTTTAATTPVSSLRDNASFGIGGANPSSAAAAVGVAGLTAAGSGAGGRRTAASGTTSASEYGSPTSMSTPPVVTPTTEFERSLAHLPTDERSNVAWARRASALGVGGGGGLQTGMYGESPIAVSTGAVTTPEKLPLPSPHIPAMELMAGVGGKETSSPSLAASSPSAGEGGSAVVVVMEDSRPASAPAPQTEYQQQQQNYYAQAQQHFTSLPSHMGGTGHAAPLTRSFARPVSPLQYRGVESNAEHEDASTGGDDGAAVSRRPPPPPPPPLPPLHPHSQDSDPRAETAPASASPGVVAGVGAGVGDDADRQHHQRLGRSADEARDHDAMQFRSGDGGAAGFLRVSSFGSGEESSLYSLNHSNAESRSVSPRPWEEHVGGLMDRAYTSTEAQMALHQRRIEEARMQEALHSLGIHTGGAAATAVSDGMLRDGLQARQEGPAGAGALRTEAGMPAWQQQQQPSSSSLHGQSLPSHQSAGGSRYATPRFATANNQASMGSEGSAVQVPAYATAADALMDWGRAYATGQPGTTSGATAAAAAVAEYTVRGGGAVGAATSINNNSHASPASVGVAGEAVSAGGPHTVGADGLTDAAPRPSAPPLTTVAETSVIRGEATVGGAAAGPAIATVRSTVVSSSNNNTSSGGGVGAGAFSGPTLFRSSTAPSAVASMAQDSATQSTSRISGGSVVGGGLYHRGGTLGSSPVVGATGAAYLLPDTLFSTSPTNAASADRLVGGTATATAPTTTTTTGNTAAAAAAGVNRRPTASTTQLGNQPANLNASMANMNGSSLFYFNNSFSGSIRDPLAASVVMQQNRTALVAELKRRRQRLQKQLGLLQREATARNIFALVRASNAAQVQYLLQEGLSNVNDRDYNGCTPLHVAAGEGNQAIVRVLLSFGADVLAVDHSGRTALDCAAANRHSGVGRYLLTIIRNKHLAQDANSGTDDGTGAITTGAEGEGEEGAGTQSDADGGFFHREERRSTATAAAAAAPAGAVFSSEASSPPAAGPAAAVGVRAAGGALGKGGVPALSAGRLGVDAPRSGELRRYGSGCVNMPDLLMGGSFAAWPPTPAHRSTAVASSGSSANPSPALPLAPTPPNVSTSSLTDSAVFFRSQPPLSPSATTQLQQQQQQQAAQMGRSFTPSSPSSPKSPRGSHAERRSTLAHLDSASDSELPPSAAGWPGRNAQAVLTGGYETTARQRIHNEGSSSSNSGGVGGVKDGVRGSEAQASTVPAAPSSAAAVTKTTLLTADYTAFDDTDKPSPASSLTAAAAANNNNDNAAAAAADAAQLPQWRRNSTPHGSSPMRPVVLSALHTSAAARSRVLIAAESSMSSLPAAAGAVAAAVPSTADSPHATWSTSTPPTAMTASALGDGRSGSPGMRPMLPPSTANARNSQQTSVTASAAASSTSAPPSTTAAATAAAAAAAAALLAVSGGGSTANAGLASNPSTLSLGRSLTSGPPSPSTAVHAANAHSSSFNSSSQLAYRGVGGGQLHTGLLPLKETRRSLGRAGTPLSQPQNVLSDAERSCTTPVMLRDRPIVSAPPYLAGGTDTPVSESVHGEDGEGRHMAGGTAHLYHSSINNQRSGTAHAAAAAAAARSPPAVAAGGNSDGYGMRSVSSSSSSHYKAARQQLPSSIPSTSFDGVYQRTPPPVSILRAAAADDDDDDDGTAATGSGTERAEEEDMELDEAELQSVLLGRREVCARQQQQQQQQQRGQSIEDTAAADDDDEEENNKRTANVAGATSSSPVRTTLTRGGGAAAGPATRMAEAGDDAHYEYHDDGGERAPSLRKQQQQQEHRQPFHHVPYPQQDGSLATTVSAGTEERGGSVVSTRDVAAAAAALGATPGTRMLQPIKLLPLDEEKERQLHRHATDGTPLEAPFYSKAKSNGAGAVEEEEEAVVTKGMKSADSDLFSNATTSAPSSAALGSTAGAGGGMGGGVHAGGRWLHPTYASSASPFPPFGLKSLDDTPPLSTDASGTGSPLTGHHNFRSSTRESLSACDVGQQSVDEHHHHFRLATTTGAAPLLQAGRDAATAMPTTTAFISAAAATATPTTSAAAGSSAAVVPTMRMAAHVDAAVATTKQGEFGSGGGGADTTQASPRVVAGEPVRSDAGSVNVDATRAATTALTAASAAPVTPAAAGKQAITSAAATAPSPTHGGDSTASAHLVQQARLLQRSGRHAMEEQSFLEEAQHEPIDLATLHHSSYTTVCDTVSIIVCMVGLPGRGKSFIGKRLVRYMNWKGVPCKVFNAGNYRRQLLGVEGTAGADFFDPNNPKGAQLREKMAELACEDLVSFIASHSLAVGILDATNTTRKRRAWLAEYFQQEAERRGVPYRLLFIESVCTDDTIITENILRSKCDNDDFKNVSDVGAIIAEFRSRIVQYEKVYETCEPAERMPYIKIINVKHHVILHHVPNGLGSRIAFFLLNLHPIAFPIYVALPGETVGDKKHVYGGEERLTARGEAYAVALKNFIQDRYVPHMVVLHATNYSVLSTLAPLMDGATEDEAALFLQVPAGGGGVGGGNGGGGGANGGVTVTTHPATAAAAAAVAAGGSAGKGASPARQTSHKPTRRRQKQQQQKQKPPALPLSTPSSSAIVASSTNTSQHATATASPTSFVAASGSVPVVVASPTTAAAPPSLPAAAAAAARRTSRVGEEERPDPLSPAQQRSPAYPSVSYTAGCTVTDVGSPSVSTRDDSGGKAQSSHSLQSLGKTEKEGDGDGKRHRHRRSRHSSIASSGGNGGRRALPGTEGPVTKLHPYSPTTSIEELKAMAGGDLSVVPLPVLRAVASANSTGESGSRQNSMERQRRHHHHHHHHHHDQHRDYSISVSTASKMEERVSSSAATVESRTPRTTSVSNEHGIIGMEKISGTEDERDDHDGECSEDRTNTTVEKKKKRMGRRDGSNSGSSNRSSSSSSDADETRSNASSPNTSSSSSSSSSDNEEEMCDEVLCPVPGLDNINFGRFSGHTAAWVKEKYPRLSAMLYDVDDRSIGAMGATTASSSTAAGGGGAGSGGAAEQPTQLPPLHHTKGEAEGKQESSNGASAAAATRPWKDFSSAAAGAAAPKATPESLPPPSLREQGSPNSPNTSSGDWQQHSGTTLLPPPVHYATHEEAIAQLQHAPTGADPRLSYCIQFPNGESCRQVNVRLEPALMAVMRTQSPVFVVAPPVPAQGILSFFMDVIPELSPTIRIPAGCVVEIGVKDGITVHPLLPDALPAYMNRSPLTVMPELQEAMAEHGGAGGDCGGAVVKDHRE